MLHQGDIVLARTGASTGKSYLYDVNDGPLVFAGFLIRIRPDGGKLSSAYLRGQLQTSYYWKWIQANSARTGQPGINGQQYASLPVPLPPTIAEQEAIAAVFSDADALIESLEQMIAKKRDIKQATMQQLLSGKTRLSGFQKKPGYKETDAGVIPEDWEVTNLCRVSKEPLQNGVFFKPSLKGKGVKLINVGDLYVDAPISSETLALFDASERDRQRYRVEDCDIFFTRSSLVPSGIAHCNIYRSNGTEPVVFDSHVIRFRPDKAKIDPSYVHKYCTGAIARRHFISGAKTMAMTTIDQSVLDKCPVVLPVLEEQRAIAAVLSEIDVDLAALEGKRDKVRALKQGMMQELLTGRIRLI